MHSFSSHVVRKINHNNFFFLKEILSSVQLMYLESYKTSLASERQAELQERINAAIKEEDERFPVKRNVTPLIKIRYMYCTCLRTIRF